MIPIHSRSRSRRQRGQAMTEYLVVVAFLGLVVWLSSTGALGTDLAQAITSYFGAFSFAISLP